MSHAHSTFHILVDIFLPIMSSTPPIKNIGAKGRSPKPGNNAAAEVVEMPLRDITKFVRTKYDLICRVLEQPYLQTSQTNGNKYLSCQICDVRSSD